MTTPNSSVGNIMSRLQGLKNVSGRPKRSVMDEPDYLSDLEQEPSSDVTGTSLPNFSNYLPVNQAQPEQDIYEEPTPQSYDVRANNVIPENEENEGGFWSKIGSKLADYVKPQNNQDLSNPVTPQIPPIETAQTDIQQGIPPVTASEEESPGWWDSIKNNAGDLWNSVNNETNKLAQKNNENLQQNPVLPTQEKEEIEKQPITEEDKKEPGTYVELGASDQVYNDLNSSPELKAEIERIFDTQITPERAQEISEFEIATKAFLDKLEGRDVALTARENSLLEKIENKDLSQSEQISMALALIAPALIAGLIGGKQGFAGGLAAGGKNVMDILSQRENERKEAEKLLPEVALEKSNVAKEKLVTVQQANELKRKITENVPNKELRELFTRDGKLLNGKLVLETGNPLLPVKSTAIRSESDFKNFKEKKMPELAEKVSSTQQGLKLLDNLDSLIEYSENEKSGILHKIPLSLYSTPTNAFKALVPASRDTFIDEDGNQVKISELYETTLEQLSDVYSQSVGSAGNKTAFKAYREHFQKMIPNPFTTGSFFKGSSDPKTVKAQINSVKDKMEDNIIKKLDSSGVDTFPISELFKESKINTNKSENKRKKNRAEEAAREVIGK